MKVIILGPAHPLRGGIADFNAGLCRAFNKANISASIVSFAFQYPRFLFPGKTQFSDAPPPPDLSIRTTINSINPFNWVKEGWKIKREKPDLLIVRYWLPFMAPCLGTIARIVASNKHTKIIAITDNVLPHEKRMGDVMLTRYFVNSCHGFVAMSKSVLKELSGFNTTKPAKYIPHPIYDIFGEPVSKTSAMEKLGWDRNRRHILFFGFIRKYKGLDLLLQAMADERVKKLDIKVVVCGEFYDDKAPYLELIRKGNLDNNVILEDRFIASEEVKYFFCASDIIVQPYHSASQSGVTQIGYHFGRPMIVTDVGGLSEMVFDGQNGYVVAPEPAAVAKAIWDFYNENKEAEFSAGSERLKHLFSWDKMVRGICDLGLGINA